MSTTTVLDVPGMTCAHCVKAVTTELGEIPEVSDVHVELHPEGVSVVTVTSSAPLVDATVREAVDEAGYDIATIRQ